MNRSEVVDDLKSTDQQSSSKKFGQFKNILAKHFNRFNLKKKSSFDEQIEDEELDLICAPDEENLLDERTNQEDSEFKEDKITKGVKFKIQDSDTVSISTIKDSIKSVHNFDDFGIEKSDVISLDKFEDDAFQNELEQENFDMSKRPPPTIKTTKTSSVSSKTSSTSKTTSSSGSNSRSVSKSRPVGKSPVPKVTKNATADKKETVQDTKIEQTDLEPNKNEEKQIKNDTGQSEIKNEIKDSNNNLTAPELLLNIGESQSAPISPIPTEDHGKLSIDNQLPIKSVESLDELSSGEKAKSSKSVKRKPSTMQHRNSKQDTASLLRRKSLTPSAKLIILCKKADWLAVETFLKQVDKKSIDNTVINEENNWSPLHYAARDNRVAIVERLIQLGFNVNTRADEDLTCLHVACSNAREDTIKLLLMKRADTMVPAGPKKQLALHMLSSKPTGQAVVPVQLILKASPKECRLFKDADQNIPLLYAVEVGNHGLAKELLTEYQKEQLEARKNGNGDGAIHISAKRRDLEMLKTLIERGCNVNMKNKEGLTILHIAALHNDESMVRYLGGLDGLNADIQDKKHRTPLHIATEKGNTRMMDFLVDKCKASLSHRTKICGHH